MLITQDYREPGGDQPRDSLTTYPAFWFLSRNYGDPASVAAGVNGAVALAFLTTFVAGGVLEHSLWLPGRGVGLLRHPTIFLFLIGQVLFPWALIRAVHAFHDMPIAAASVVEPSFLKIRFIEHGRRLNESLRRENNRSKVLYSVLIGVGLISFMWNSFQNQQPIRFLGFEFWDSITHPIGYWSTRLYKFYQWVFLIPACAHILICLVFSLKKLLLDMTESNSLRLEPYHEDKYGGSCVFVDTVLSPITLVTVLASLSAGAALFIHQKFDFATIGGLSMALALLTVVYGVPALSLRRTIRREKKRRLHEISSVQNAHFQAALSRSAEADVIKAAAEVIGALNELADKIRGLPDWPRHARLLRVMGVVIGSPFLGWLGGVALSWFN